MNKIILLLFFFFLNYVSNPAYSSFVQEEQALEKLPDFKGFFGIKIGESITKIKNKIQKKIIVKEFSKQDIYKLNINDKTGFFEKIYVFVDKKTRKIVALSMVGKTNKNLNDCSKKALIFSSFLKNKYKNVIFNPITLTQGKNNSFSIICDETDKNKLKVTLVKNNIMFDN